MATASGTDSLVGFKTHNEAFNSILGTSPSITLMAEDANGLHMFHEACVYDPASKSVTITSNQTPLPAGQSDPATGNKAIYISRVYDSPDPSSVTVTSVDIPDLQMANGAVNYKSGILFCAQGNLDLTGVEGLVYVPDLSRPQVCHSLVSTFYGRPFNSVNDVVVHPVTGTIWFTDPCYGYRQGIRPKPQLPNQVYCFNPDTGSIRAVADGFQRPNGICFAPDLRTLYITDTGAIDGSPDVAIDPAGPSHIYAFDVEHMQFLTNRRLFAYASGGWPDGIKCDMEGNVYSGCGDGIEVWNARGEILGRILIKGGAANFCFGDNGTIYACNETKLWKVSLAKHVVGALLNT